MVLPPSRLPATRRKQTDYLAAVSPLERMGRWQTALPAYRSCPGTLAGQSGGNGGDWGVPVPVWGTLASTEAHFRDAIEQFPGEGVLFNNLAQILLEQGRRDEALEAVRQAIACGGPLKAHFEQTLEEIRNR